MPEHPYTYNTQTTWRVTAYVGASTVPTISQIEILRIIQAPPDPDVNIYSSLVSLIHPALVCLCDFEDEE